MDEIKTGSESKQKKKQSKKRIVCENLSFAAKEAFKRLRTNLVMSFPQEDTSCHLIGITSAQPSDGKSTVAINLAFSLAELGKKEQHLIGFFRYHSRRGCAKESFRAA